MLLMNDLKFNYKIPITTVISVYERHTNIPYLTKIQMQIKRAILRKLAQQHSISCSQDCVSACARACVRAAVVFSLRQDLMDLRLASHLIS